MDSDLSDAPYNTEYGRVYLLQKTISLICNNSSIRENVMVELNNILKMPEYSDVGIQTYDVIGISRGKERVDIKLLHYKPENIFKFIDMLQSMTKTKFEDFQTIMFMRDCRNVCEFNIDFRKSYINRTAINNLVMAEVEHNMMLGMFKEFNRYIK